MKKILILFLILIVACAVPEDVPAAEQGLDSMPELPEEPEPPIDVPDKGIYEVGINEGASSFTFEGYAPGKSHEGSFDEMEGVIVYQDGEIIGARGIIQADSVNTGIDGLDSKLKQDEFFDVAVYPEITFNSVKIKEGTMNGKLTFRGVSEIISFPVEVTENTMSTEFLLDTTPYAMTYVGVDKQVRIKFFLVSK